jgi:hypothetical protein
LCDGPNMTRFTANKVLVDDSDADFILVAFADEQEGEYREAIHFQRAYEFDEQDVQLGMDDVYIERGIQTGSGYGGIDSVDLYRDLIRISVSGRTAESLGGDLFEIDFAIDQNEFTRLRDGLRRVFDGRHVLTENVA